MEHISFKTPRVLITIFSVLLLSACGSADDTETTPGEEVALTGTLNNMLISGLSYSTETQSGVSNENGEFLFKDGETIQFSLAGYELGSVAAAENMDFFALFATSQPKQRQLNAYLDGSLNRGSDAPINKALNTALLLQSLDDDSDLSNGIQITASQNSALSVTDYKINFSDDSYDFISDLKRVFKQAGLEKTPLQQLNSIRHLVNSNVITTPLYRVTRYETDSDANGVADRVYHYDYDAQGNIPVQSTDDNADGSINRVATYSYDVNGNITMQSYDQNNDGTADQKYSYAYDSHSNRISYSIHGNGDDDVTTTYTYTYDSYGNLLTYERDGNNSVVDGTVDTRYTSIYNAWGDKVRYELDSDADGDFDSLYVYSFDEQGNQVKYDYYNNADGILYSTNNYQFDEQGNRIYSESVKDGDIYSKYHYEFDAMGNQIKQISDSNADDTADRIYSYGFDENGNLIRRENDNNADGTAEVVYRYGYYENGNLEGYQTEVNGEVDRAIVSRYDEAGNLIEQLTLNDFGETVSVASYTFESTTIFSKTVSFEGER